MPGRRRSLLMSRKFLMPELFYSFNALKDSNRITGRDKRTLANDFNEKS